MPGGFDFGRTLRIGAADVGGDGLNIMEDAEVNWMDGVKLGAFSSSESNMEISAERLFLERCIAVA